MEGRGIPPGWANAYSAATETMVPSMNMIVKPENSSPASEPEAGNPLGGQFSGFWLSTGGKSAAESTLARRTFLYLVHVARVTTTSG